MVINSPDTKKRKPFPHKLSQKKWRNLKVGDFNKNVKRELPTIDRFRNYSNRFLNSDMLKDYDAYLWGSFPERKTKDVDIILQKRGGNPNPQEMEEIAMASLEESLVNNNFLADLGFTKKKIAPFTDYMNHYSKTGIPGSTRGQVFGDKWVLDGKVWKDRTQGLTLHDGTREKPISLGNNMLELRGEIPYKKMLRRMEKDPSAFSMQYAGKPYQIKNAGERYS